MTCNSHCIFCHTIFLTVESYQKHLLKKQALPFWDGIETSSSAAPTESAFRGKLRRYDLKVGEKEIDLLQVMMQNKEEIDALIQERVKEGPNKVQFHVEVGMIKTPTEQDGGTGNFERTMLFLNTRTMTVYFEVIAGDQYWNWSNIWSTKSIRSLLMVADGLSIELKNCKSVSLPSHQKEQDPTSSYLMHSALLLLCSQISTLKMMTVVFYTALFEQPRVSYWPLNQTAMP